MVFLRMHWPWTHAKIRDEFRIPCEWLTDHTERNSSHGPFHWWCRRQKTWVGDHKTYHFPVRVAARAVLTRFRVVPKLVNCFGNQFQLVPHHMHLNGYVNDEANESFWPLSRRLRRSRPNSVMHWGEQYRKLWFIPQAVAAKGYLQKLCCRCLNVNSSDKLRRSRWNRKFVKMLILVL